MTSTPAQLGARALRKLGVAIVADAGRPGAGPTFTAEQAAARVVRELGIPVAEADRPDALPPVGLTELGARTLRSLGINPVAGVDALATTTFPEIATQALRGLGINPIAGAAATATTTLAAIAAQALRGLGVNPLSGVSASGLVVTQVEIARRALRSIGVNPLDAAGTGGTTDTFTVAAVAGLVLLKLAVIASDETPSTQDQADALQKTRAVHDILVKLGYVTWGVDVIPADAVEHYIVMASNLLAPEFGKQASMEAYAAAQEMLRVRGLSGATAQTRAEARVQTVHDTLVAEAMADWTLATIPEAVADAYVAMVAAMLAPVHGKAADGSAYATGMASVRRTVLSGPRGQAMALDRAAAVQNEMVAGGYVDAGLPLVAAMDAYVELVQQALGPVYGKSQDDAARVVAEGRIRRLALSGSRAQALAESRAYTVQAEFAANGMVYGGQPLLASSDAYVELIQQALGPVYGKPIDAAARAAAELRIRRMALSGQKGQALAEAKVQAVQDALSVQGLVSWPVTAVPAAHAEDYVAMASVLLAPVVGRDADGTAWEAAEGRLRRAGMIRGAQERALAKIRSVYDEMNGMGVVDFPINGIPGSMLDAMTGMAATLMGEDAAGKPVDPKAMELAYQRIRRVAMGGPAGQVLAEQKIRAVHASLDARGRTRWTLYDLPIYAEEPYVLMAATWLAPEVGERADPNWWDAAERDLMRIVSVPSAERPVIGAYF